MLFFFATCFATVNAETYSFSFKTVYTDESCTTEAAKGTNKKHTTLTTFYSKETTSNKVYTFTVKEGDVYLSSNGYIMFYKGGSIVLPTFNGEAVTNITYTTSSGTVAKATMQVYSGENKASEEITQVSGSNSLDIYKDYQSSELTLKNTSSTKNAQIVTLTITTSTSSSGPTTCTVPTNLTPADGTVYKATDNETHSVLAKAPGDNYSVEYSTDQSNWSSSLSFKPSDYATAGTLTVYARTKDTSGSLEPSSAISATYSITSDILDGFSALRSKIIEDNSTSEKTYYVEHSKLYVTRGGGNNYYMQDADAGILLFKCNETVGTSYEEGLATVKGCYYGNALVELTSFTTTGTKGTYTDSELSPKVVTLSDLSDGKYEGMLVKVRKVMVNTDPSTNSTTANTGEIADNDGNTFVLYEPGTTKPALTEKSRYNIVGIPGLYYNSKTSESTKELMLYREADATLLGADVTLTISPSGYSSLYYSDRNLALPEGVKGYVCSYTEGSSTINAEEVYNYDATDINAVPKDCAVILEGTANTAYTLEAVDDDDVVFGKDYLTNILQGTDDNETISAEDGKYIYFFGYDSNNNNTPGFFMSSDLTNYAHKAYIQISYDASAQGAKALVLDFGKGSTTSINSAAAAESISDGKIFTIEGVQVNSKNLKPGLYIKNGRKFIVK